MSQDPQLNRDPICPILHRLLILLQIIQIILFIVDSRCTKHITGNLKLLCNFIEKYLGTVRFGNDQFSLIIGYRDLVQGNVTIKRVYYVEGLNHNLFSVGQFCDADLEVAFRKYTCFVRDLQENDLLTGIHGYDLYRIALQESSSPTQSVSWQNLHQLNHENGVVGRWNCTMVEAARTMLSASKLPLFFWAEAIATACYTQNRSLIILKHEKTPYHIINDRKHTLKNLHIFGFTCYIVRDGENLDKMKEKGDSCIFMGYSTQSKGYKVYNKRTRLIVDSIHINFDELKEVMTFEHNSSGLGTQDHNNEPLSSKPSSAHSDNSLQQDTQLTLNVQPIIEPIIQPINVIAEENNTDQAEDAQFKEHELINPFCTPMDVKMAFLDGPLKEEYPKDSGFELTAFSDPDHAGCLDTHKSTYGGIQFLGDRLVSWMSKNQDCTTMSTAEAKYVALSASCAQHSFTKYINVRYHFIKEQVEHGIVELCFVRTEYQLAEMFTKALLQERFEYLVGRIGMRCLTSTELKVPANESA
ncbi:retrovirus-related pol polyprotein from transposon TNT 1-94 [Tanacetum coccineum]